MALERARVVAVSPGEDVEARIAAIPLLDAMPLADSLEAFDQLLAKKQPASLQQAAFALMPRLNRSDIANYLFKKWPDLGPVAQSEAITFLTSSNATVKPLLTRMKNGEIPAALLNLEKRWKYGRSPDAELQALAKELFGSPSPDRAAILADYQAALKLPGDAAEGHALFTATCAACHRLNGEGVDVAPDISDVRIKPPEALLSDILDPNRVVETRWSAVAVETTDGLALTGIIDAETPDALTIKMQGGISQAIPRSKLKNLTPLNQSLMPVGLEAALTKQQMADLLAFLKKR
jgi:putative heme-binding domain-containing protein